MASPNFWLFKATSLSVDFQQDELEYWKSRAARLTLLVEQINTLPCKMTVVTLKTAQCKLVKVSDTY